MDGWTFSSLKAAPQKRMDYAQLFGINEETAEPSALTAAPSASFFEEDVSTAVVIGAAPATVVAAKLPSRSTGDSVLCAIVTILVFVLLLVTQLSSSSATANHANATAATL